MAGAQDNFRFVLRGSHPFRVRDAEMKSQIPLRPQQLQGRAQRDINKIVLGLSKNGADSLSQTDNLETLSFQTDELAQRVAARKQVFGHVLADHADGAAVAA